MVRNLILLFSIVSASFHSKADTYAVYFKDKGENLVMLNNPALFLSEASIERRRVQGIGVFESDLPISRIYTDSIKKYPLLTLQSSKWLNCMLIETNDINAIQQIKVLDFVKDVKLVKSNHTAFQKKTKDLEVNGEQISLAFSSPNFYGLSDNQNRMIKVDYLHKKGFMGEGVKVAVFDVGFRNANNIAGFADMFATGRYLGSWDMVDQEENVFDNGGHGTACLATMAAFEEGRFIGTSPKASYALFRTEDEKSETLVEEYNWVFAAEFAESGGAQVFTTSLGYTTFDDPATSHTYQDLDGNTTPISVASNVAARSGIIVVTSAGNEGAGSWYYISAPADADSVLAIGAVKSNREIARFSSKGPNSKGRIKPDVCAQGERATVYLPDGSTIQSNGTSFSGPILAGAMTCLRQAFPSIRNLNLYDAVRSSAHLFKSPNDSFGYGIPDMAVAYLLLKRQENPLSPQQVSEVEVFPNPISNQFEVYLTVSKQDKIDFELVDINGRVVMKGNANFTSNDRKHTIIVSENIPKGTYLLKLTGKDFYELKMLVRN